MSLLPQLRPRAKIKGTKTSTTSVFIAKSLYWTERITRPIILDTSRRVDPNSWLTWPGTCGSRIGFRTWVIFFKIGAGVTYTVELVSISSFQKYIHFPKLDIPPRKYLLLEENFQNSLLCFNVCFTFTILSQKSCPIVDIVIIIVRFSINDNKDKIIWQQIKH